MFSYEDRLRAVQLHIKLGKRTGLTIRQLDYPTKNALMSWCRKFEGNQDLRAGYARRPRYPETSAGQSTITLIMAAASQ
jgi:putative transposase